ncbi:MAG: AbrB/MazE/SpoVT family DNA-binding domain-containing protein [Verrucomicrobiota bacterium]|jgi:AbrB family looped-hinge helix DNA binding protein
MHATIYGRGQMVIPAKARKQAHIDTGDVVSVEPDGDGRLILVRLEKPKPHRHQIRLLRRRGKHSILTGGPAVTTEQVRAALAGLP